ncbi:hypothetical protein J7384_10830 [Endozoicomonas sp. G2_1]|uniref:hypothetical protein n=1 Tax=Endozoicomonas sp. G2_1 TaxID=2821091 RepID=UPI001ADBEFCA|nr:hypothetical protein [Endozoicomonas sp. G2_1]MBO9490851.1 hypothetical protein [Endozoicomonas sp. G2_1]
MKRLVAVFKVVIIVLLGALSLKVMYSNPIKGETKTVFAKTIEQLNCPVGKYADPYFIIVGSQTKFYVMKEFVYWTDCDTEPNKLMGKKVSFIYFISTDLKSEVIQLSLEGNSIYTKNEFIGKTKLIGVLLFFGVMAFLIWSLVTRKRA